MTDVVVLVDDDGRVVGEAPRLGVHDHHTPLHLAFSLHLFDPDGRVLLTRRALAKRTWPGVWTNSCCGHPRPDEDGPVAIGRRLGEELGVEVDDLRCVLPHFRYRAVDASGVVENELCPVWVGRVRGTVLADPDEVAEWSWLPWDDLVTAITAAPPAFSPWAALAVPAMVAAGFAPGRWPTAPHPRSGRTPVAETSTADVAGREPVAPAAAPSWTETRDALDRRLEQVLADVEETWFRLAPGVDPGVIDDDLPMLLRRLVQSGGKRIRPAMVHWGWLAAAADAGERADQHTTVVDAAAALELLHVFALVHDDVMDESGSRRGRPTTHVGVAALHRRAGGRGSDQRFGESIAILVGDLAHAEADHLAGGLPPEVRSTYRTTLLELVQGQRLDLTGAAAGRRDLVHARSVAEAKSGAYTVQRPLQMGAQVAGGGLELQHALLRYGRHAGAAFALRDDLLGLWGDPERTGKPVGDDLVAGKPTVVLALAADRLAGHWRTVVDGRSVVPLDAHEVAGVLDAMVEAGVRDEVEDMIANEVRVADEALDDGQVAPEAAEGLRAMARSLAWREA